jgi:hypothetical protein
MVIPTLILCTEEDLALPEELRGDSQRFVLQMRSITKDLTFDMPPYERFCHVLNRCQAIGMDESTILKQLFRASDPSTAAVELPKKGTKVVHPDHGTGTITQVLQPNKSGRVPISPITPRVVEKYAVQFENGVFEQMPLAAIRRLILPSTIQERTCVTKDELNTGLRRISPTLFNLSREEMEEIWERLDPQQTGLVSAEQLIAVLADMPKQVPSPGSRASSSHDSLSSAMRERLSGHNGPTVSIASFAHEYLRDCMVAEKRRQWGMMYCGGSSAVEQDLRVLQRTYGLHLSVESFAW